MRQAIGLIACFIAGGCSVAPADGSADRDQSQHSGFYTGMTGGLIDTMGH